MLITLEVEISQPTILHKFKLFKGKNRITQKQIMQKRQIRKTTKQNIEKWKIQPLKKYKHTHI